MLLENRLFHVALAILPVLLAPLLLFAIAEGWLDFGGGEKDLLLVIPYFIGASTFFISAIYFIIKKRTLLHWFTRSILLTAAVLVALGVAAHVTSWLGVA